MSRNWQIAPLGNWQLDKKDFAQFEIQKVGFFRTVALVL